MVNVIKQFTHNSVTDNKWANCVASASLYYAMEKQINKANVSPIGTLYTDLYFLCTTVYYLVNINLRTAYKYLIAT